MTPEHEKIVDSMLQSFAGKAMEHMQYLGQKVPSLVLEQLREGPLGQDLTNIAYLAEGYPAEGNIDEMIQRVLRHCFGPMIQFSTNTTLRLPKGWQKTPFGLMVGNAYRRLIPAKDRMTTAQASRALGVKRQTLYDWVEEGQIRAFYIHEKQMFYRPSIQKLVEQRQKQQSRDRIVEQLHPKS